MYLYLTIAPLSCSTLATSTPPPYLSLFAFQLCCFLLFSLPRRLRSMFFYKIHKNFPFIVGNVCHNQPYLLPLLCLALISPYYYSSSIFFYYFFHKFFFYAFLYCSYLIKYVLYLYLCISVCHVIPGICIVIFFLFCIFFFYYFLFWPACRFLLWLSFKMTTNETTT